MWRVLLLLLSLLLFLSAYLLLLLLLFYLRHLPVVSKNLGSTNTFIEQAVVIFGECNSVANSHIVALSGNVDTI